MLKRTFLLLAVSFTMLLSASRVTAAEEGAEKVAPEYHLIPQSAEEVKQALYSAVWVLVIFIIMVAILYPTAWRFKAGHAIRLTIHGCCPAFVWTY